MTLPLVLLPAARIDFDDSFDWYEEQRPGFGAALAARVQETLEWIADRPQLYEIALDDVRRARVRQFPYVILYRVEPERIAVLAVFHTSRDPRIWQRRL